MFEIVLSFCLQFYERGSNKALYRLVLLPPKITKPAQTFQIAKKILLKMYLKIQLDPARKANSHRQHQSSQTLSISEEKTSEKRLFTTKVNTKKKNPKRKSLLWQMFAKSNHSDWVEAADATRTISRHLTNQNLSHFYWHVHFFLCLLFFWLSLQLESRFSGRASQSGWLEVGGNTAN